MGRVIEGVEVDKDQRTKTGDIVQSFDGVNDVSKTRMTPSHSVV